jgi:hypothetical protein
VWDAGLQRLVWPLAGSHAQIVGDLGKVQLAQLATTTSVESSKPHLSTQKGFTAAQAIPYASTVVHEMRYSTAELGQRRQLGDVSVYTGAMLGGSFESQAFESRARPAGLVRGRPAIYIEVRGRYGTLAWERVPGEVNLIGFSGASRKPHAVEVLRSLADHGKVLTPAQWLTPARG